MALKVPMGRLEKFEIGSRKLTIQTEFIQGAANCKIETKVYVGGELKKVYALDVNTEGDQDLQQALDEFHRARVQEISDGLRRKTPGVSP
jgi:hypothetical protein